MFQAGNIRAIKRRPSAFKKGTINKNKLANGKV